MQLTLISLYYYVCQRYNNTLRWEVQRFSPNLTEGNFTDEEIITIYLFCVAFQEKYKVKSMYTYISLHWIDWFPKLPAYPTFVNRLNRIAPVFPLLVSELISDFDTNETSTVLVDSIAAANRAHYHLLS